MMFAPEKKLWRSALLLCTVALTLSSCAVAEGVDVEPDAADAADDAVVAPDTVGTDAAVTDAA